MLAGLAEMAQAGGGEPLPPGGVTGPIGQQAALPSVLMQQ